MWHGLPARVSDRRSHGLVARATNSTGADQWLQRPVSSFIRTRARYVRPGWTTFAGTVTSSADFSSSDSHAGLISYLCGVGGIVCGVLGGVISATRHFTAANCPAPLNADVRKRSPLAG